MHAGRIAALGSPRELKASAFPGTLYAAATVPAPETMERIAADGLIVSAARFGAGLHLHVRQGGDTAFRKMLPRGIRLERIEPSLEDVFLETVRRPEEKKWHSTD